MSTYNNEPADVHHSRPPRDPNRRRQRSRNEQPQDQRSSHGSNRSSLEHGAPAQRGATSQHEGGRPHYDQRSSHGSNRSSLEHGAPAQRGSTNQHEGGRPQYDQRPTRSGRPTSTSSAESQPSVYDEIPVDQVATKKPGQPRGNNNRRPRQYRNSDTSQGSDSRVPGRNPVNMRPSGGHSGISMKPSGSPARHSQNSASPEMVDLNVSKLSQSSDQSVVTLGGVEYPVGSRIGTTGMFVIGDPSTYPKHDTSSFRSSMPSVVSSTAPIYRGDGKAYSFETWSWTAIRFSIFIILCIIMLALLAAIIAVCIEHKKGCEAHFEWWKGSTFYNLPVPYFYDSDTSNIGDITGIERKVAYFEFAGISAIVLKNFLASEPNHWDLINSFTELDERLGKTSDFEQMVTQLHERDVRVLIHVCPWYTSTKHVWFEESRGSSLASLSKYRDFYIWSDQPDTRQTGDWQYDIVRSQHYLHYADNTKPVLNWKNTKVRDTFKGVLELWLQRGVDGISLCELNRFYTDDYDFLQQIHATLSSYSLGEDTQKVLIVDGDFMAETARLNYPLFEDFVDAQESSGRTIDMIQTSLYMDDLNRTAGLVSRIQSALEWQALVNGPWVTWDLTRLTTIDIGYVGALQLLDLMLPGTPGYTAGQEIGLFYLEVKSRYMAPMLWMPDSVIPFNPGSSLSSNQIYAMRNISTRREEVLSLRFDKIIGREDNGLTFNIMEVDQLRNFILFSRFYPQDKTYYYAANFGDRTMKKDLEVHIAPWATVLADSQSRYFGRLELREVELEAGQAIVFSPTK